jgi:hypothetical protein
MRPKRTAQILLLLVFNLYLLSCWAQETGSITGRIVDSSGRMTPGGEADLGTAVRLVSVPLAKLVLGDTGSQVKARAKQLKRFPLTKSTGLAHTGRCYQSTVRLKLTDLAFYFPGLFRDGFKSRTLLKTVASDAL